MKKLSLFAIVALTTLSTAGLTLHAQAQSMTSSVGITFVGEATPQPSEPFVINGSCIQTKDADSVRVRFDTKDAEWMAIVDDQIDLDQYGDIQSLAIEVVPEN